MPKFRVNAIMTESLYLDIEAADEDEAMEIAHNTDGGEFIPLEGSCDWTLSSADLLENDND